MKTTFSSRRWEWDELQRARREALSLWSTGAAIDLDECVEFVRALPAEKNCALRLAQAKRQGEVLLQPRAALTILEHHIETLLYLQNEGGADILPTQVDSYSRELRFDRAQAGLEESLAAGRSRLNGLPIVIYGHQACRKIVETVDVPLCLRLVTPDARLVAEMGFAAGYTGLTSHGIDAAINFAKDYPIDRAIWNWQYADRLAAHYQENGAPIFRQYRGLCDACHLPPSLTFACSILEALVGAAQGVKVMSVDLHHCGALVSEVAGLRVMARLGEEYLARLGYGDVTLVSVADHWIGQFPPDRAQAYALINMATIAAVLGGANMIIVKSVEEGVGIPTKEANAASCRATRATVGSVQDQRLSLDRVALAEEERIVELEARAILDRTLEMGDGDVAIGIVRAFEAGVLDSILSPSRFARGELMVVRDRQGTMRYLEAGNLPFSREVLEYNREKIAERERAEGRTADYEMLVDDIDATAAGRLLKPREPAKLAVAGGPAAP
ncbi:MAG: methylaspartate mutase subunit E [Chloroflexi bacterium]|nr:methylaspartate mutase subunit E [Chloroflexota bacterium]